MRPLSIALVSYRLGGPDGVSVEAAKAAWALTALGHRVVTVAGAGRADVMIRGLGADPSAGDVDVDRLTAVVRSADLVMVDNVLSLPLNPRAGATLAALCAGRPTLVRHHDLPWQREHLQHAPVPPDDPAWRHVTINERNRRQLAERGINAVVLRNAFRTDGPTGDRHRCRAALGLPPATRLVVQPTRAIARKRVGAALALAERLHACFWLVGPAEDGYASALGALLAAARTGVRRGPFPPMAAGAGMQHAYAAADLVAFPSNEEGFGNPPVEASIARRPVAIGPYEVGLELRQLGFEWLDADDHDSVAAWIERPDPAVLDHNAAVAHRHLDLADLPRRVGRILEEAAWFSGRGATGTDAGVP